MNVMLPSGFAAFRSAHEAGRGTLLWRRSVADLETPVAAFLKLAHGQPNSFLLESIEGGDARGRYSIIGMAPDLIWRCRAGQAELNRHALSAPHAFVAEELARSTVSAPSSPNRGSMCRTGCRRWRAGWSVTSDTTWSG